MKLHYYPETDSLYIELIDVPGTESRAVAETINLDLDQEGRLVGIDIDQASKNLDLDKLETIALPVKTTKAA